VGWFLIALDSGYIVLIDKSALESQLAEEPFVFDLSRVVSFLEDLSDGLSDLASLALVLWISGLSWDGLLEVNVEGVSSGHQVVVVDHLDEGSDLGSSSNLLLAHSADDSSWVAVDACNDGVSVGSVGDSFIGVVDDDGFAAGVSAIEDDDDFTTCNWFEYSIVVVLASILLLAALIMALFWTLYYGQGYDWNENPEKQFNLHPPLMIAGFITLSGFAMLLYRIGRCCGHLYVRLFHAFFHCLAIACIALGFIAVYNSKYFSQPSQPHFYSLHSWL